MRTLGFYNVAGAKCSSFRHLDPLGYQADRGQVLLQLEAAVTTTTKTIGLGESGALALAGRKDAQP